MAEDGTGKTVCPMVDRGMTVADVARYTGLAVADVQTLLGDATI
jgi:hypothetical protein